MLSVFLCASARAYVIWFRFPDLQLAADIVDPCMIYTQPASGVLLRVRNSVQHTAEKTSLSGYAWSLRMPRLAAGCGRWPSSGMIEQLRRSLSDVSINFHSFSFIFMYFHISPLFPFHFHYHFQCTPRLDQNQSINALFGPKAMENNANEENNYEKYSVSWFVNESTRSVSSRIPTFVIRVLFVRNKPIKPFCVCVYVG